MEKENELTIFQFIAKNYDRLIKNKEILFWIQILIPSITEKENILVTNELLLKINNIEDDEDIDCNQLKRNVVKYLKYNSIEFEELNYEDERINNYSYILNEIPTLRRQALKNKTWIVLSPTSFKEFICCNSNLSEVRDYYFQIENIIYEYNNYQSEIKIKNLKIDSDNNEMKSKASLNKVLEDLSLKDKEILDLQFKMSMLKDFFFNTTSSTLTKTQILYIITEKNNLYRIGGVEDVSLLQETTNDLFYCFDYKLIENTLSFLLSNFKVNEMYQINKEVLIEIINNILKQHDDLFSFKESNKKLWFDRTYVLNKNLDISTQ